MKLTIPFRCIQKDTNWRTMPECILKLASTGVCDATMELGLNENFEAFGRDFIVTIERVEKTPEWNHKHGCRTPYRWSDKWKAFSNTLTEHTGYAETAPKSWKFCPSCGAPKPDEDKQ